MQPDESSFGAMEEMLNQMQAAMQQQQQAHAAAMQRQSELHQQQMQSMLQTMQMQAVSAASLGSKSPTSSTLRAASAHKAVAGIAHTLAIVLDKVEVGLARAVVT